MIEVMVISRDIEMILPYECFVGMIIINDRKYEFNFTPNRPLDEMMESLKKAKRIVKRLFKDEALTVRNSNGEKITLDWKKFCTFFQLIFNQIIHMSENRITTWEKLVQLRLRSEQTRVYHF